MTQRWISGTMTTVATVLCLGVGTIQDMEPFVDKGACPFECCQYGRWKAMADAVVYDKPVEGAEAVGMIRAGRRVRALTGEVHTIPGMFRVHREHGRYRPGDVIEVLTPSGEGLYRVRFGGEIYHEDLGFGPEGIIPDSRCSDSPSCFGELDEELQYTWWVKLRTPGGSEGWVKDPDGFRGMDACG